MIYEVESKNDFSMGTSIIVRIPEEHLDKSALYTLVAEKPEFILPLRYRSIEGQIEFVYQIGSLRPLHDFPEIYPSKECAELWSKILSPFLECGDWFMRPYSFLLDTQYLFFDRDNKSVRYVYIPSIRDCCEQERLRQMAVEVAGIVTVDDVLLENIILRMIIKSFNPKDFLQKIKPFSGANAQLPNTRNTSSLYTTRQAADIPEQTLNIAEPIMPRESELDDLLENNQEIVINLSAGANSRKYTDLAKNEVTSGTKKKAKKPRKNDNFFSRLKDSVREEVIIT